jgi:hypothetical protein
MKHCTKCGRQYSDPSLKYCTEDGTPLSPQFDSEAQTVRIAPAMSPEDLVLEIANYLRRCGIEDGLVQFEPLAKGFGVTVAEIAEQFEAAAVQVDYAVTKKTETRAWIRRNDGISFRWSPLDE